MVPEQRQKPPACVLKDNHKQHCLLRLLSATGADRANMCSPTTGAGIGALLWGEGSTAQRLDTQRPMLRGHQLDLAIPHLHQHSESAWDAHALLYGLGASNDLRGLLPKKPNEPSRSHVPLQAYGCQCLGAQSDSTSGEGAISCKPRLSMKGQKLEVPC